MLISAAGEVYRLLVQKGHDLMLAPGALVEDERDVAIEWAEQA